MLGAQAVVGRLTAIDHKVVRQRLRGWVDGARVAEREVGGILPPKVGQETPRVHHDDPLGRGKLRALFDAQTSGLHLFKGAVGH
eukprot:4427791-Pleurochrysis_carterae.AAC.3